MPTPEANLYIIGGVYSYGTSDLPFSGHFSTNEIGRIRGTLIDRYGPASIEGTFFDDRDHRLLTFLKRYLPKPEQSPTERSINYRYSKKDELWVGEYVTTKLDGSQVLGHTRCVVTQFREPLTHLDTSDYDNLDVVRQRRLRYNSTQQPLDTSRPPICDVIDVPFMSEVMSDLENG